MPELPEVETTLQGLKPHALNQKISEIIIRHPRLRWPIPLEIKEKLRGQRITEITRRAKYLLLTTKAGTLILHLGMSGRVRVLTENLTPGKHDHFDIIFSNNSYLRFTDPRRFGALLFTTEDPYQHPLIKNIGPEPLTSDFNGDYLWELSRGEKSPR